MSPFAMMFGATLGKFTRGTATNWILALVALLGILAMLFNTADANPYLLTPTKEVKANAAPIPPRRHQRGPKTRYNLTPLIRLLKLDNSTLSQDIKELKYIDKCNSGDPILVDSPLVSNIRKACVKKTVTQNSIKCVLARFRKYQLNITQELKNLSLTRIDKEGNDFGNNNRTESICYMFHISRSILNEIEITANRARRSNITSRACTNIPKFKIEKFPAVKFTCHYETMVYKKLVSNLSDWKDLLVELRASVRKGSSESGQRSSGSRSVSSSESENKSRRPKKKTQLN